jgi:hypothetical protein
VDPFVVSINAAGQAAYRSFWSGRWGTVVLIVPGLIVAVIGVVLGLTSNGSGPAVFFAGVIVISGLYAGYAGWDHRRKALWDAETPPPAFVLEPDGVVFPPHKRYAWSEVRFVLTDEEPARILCTPVGLAYAVDRLDREPADIDTALATMSSGQTRLERV